MFRHGARHGRKQSNGKTRLLRNTGGGQERLRRGDQEGLPQAGHEVPSDRNPDSKEAEENSRKAKEAYEMLPTSRSGRLRSLRSCGRRSELRVGAGMGGAGGCRCFRRYLRRDFRCGWAAGPQVYRGADLKYTLDITLEQAARLRYGNPCTQLGNLRRVAAVARPRHAPAHLPHLRRCGRGAHAAGLLQRAADLPTHWYGQGDHRPVQRLRRVGAATPQQDPAGQDSGRYRRRYAHPLGGQWRTGRKAVAPATLRRDSPQAARHLSRDGETCTAN